MDTALDRLAKLGIVLPQPAAPPLAASYRRFVRVGDVGYASGHLPFDGTKMLFKGRVGADLTVEEGAKAARAAGLSLLRTVRDELGSLDAVREWLKVTVYVQAVDDFQGHPLVANGFTDLLREAWGPNLLPVRTAVGVAHLPLGTPVELDAVVALAGGRRRI